MLNEFEVKKDEELTLLALGEKYALVGDNYGLVRRACIHCLNRIKTTQPLRVYMEDGALREFSTVRDYMSGLGVSVCFDPATRAWYVEEVGDPITGWGSGRFFFTSRDSLTFTTV